MNKKSSKSLPAQSLARGLEILEFIAFSRRSVRLKDISKAFDLDMASTHRALKTLEQMDYVTRLSVGKAYGPGEKLRALSGSFMAMDKILGKLKPVVVGLAEATGQIAHIAVLRENNAVLTEIALSNNAIVSIRQAPGDVDELYCSAVGKSLLAFLPTFEQNALLRTIQFEEHTEHTITSMAAFKRELKDVQANGIAYDDREGNLEISCIGAPILDADNFSVAAIGISMLANSLDGNIRDQQEKTDLVAKAANQSSLIIQENLTS